MNNEVKKERTSSIELMRIILIVMIIAHHYVVNSGIMESIAQNLDATFKNIFLLLVGGWGKIGINCFVLITGYYMCKSHITLNKFLKLVLEVLFYSIILNTIFWATGYNEFTLKGFIKAMLPINSIATNFMGCYLVFYLFIPFINKLLNALDKKTHALLIIVLLFFFSVLPSIGMGLIFNYVGWFAIIYIIGAYIRMYPNSLFDSTKKSTIGFITTILLCNLSIVAMYFITNKIHHGGYYFFVADSNKILAVITSVFIFLFFKNIHIKQCKVINIMASTTLGVLLIHANSDAMRQWLWGDTLKNTVYYANGNIFLHALLSVLIVYLICVLIDLFRIYIVEKPTFKLINKIEDNYKSKHSKQEISNQQ